MKTTFGKLPVGSLFTVEYPSWGNIVLKKIDSGYSKPNATILDENKEVNFGKYTPVVGTLVH